MSQCRPERLLPPASGNAMPRATWHVPPIFSSKSVSRVPVRISSFMPKATSPR